MNTVSSLLLQINYCTKTLGKESACNAGDMGDVGSIPKSGRSLEVEIATHSSILAWKFYMDRGAWQDIFHGIAKNTTIAIEHN